LIERRTLELGRRFLDDQARSISTTFDVTHESSVYRVRHVGLQDCKLNPPGWACRQSVSLYL
jgi:hypothetical protein